MRQLREQPEIYWAAPQSSVVDVFRKNVNNVDALAPAAIDRLRQSQILSSDPPVKVLEEKDGWFLVQMVDLTRGWVPAKFLAKLPPKNYWGTIKRFGKSLLPVKFTASHFVIALQNWATPRYAWGGRRASGQDCSGFIQSIFLKETGYWLPKHSRDQAALGRPVKGAWAIGDLVLMQNKETGVAHIGVVSDPDQKMIFHHARQNGTPRFESWPDMAARYRFLSVNRLLSFAPSK